MRKNDISLLRTLIREMVSEAPYRASSVVTLRPVQGTGISLGAAALATGAGALSAAYTWLSERCTGQHSNFPIRYSSKSKDKLITQAGRSGIRLIDQQELWKSYQDTIGESGTNSNVNSSMTLFSDKSDRAANYELYGLATKPLPLWTPAPSSWSDLGPIQRLDVVSAMVPLMMLYTGCDTAHIQGLIGNTASDAQGNADRLDKFPFASRNDLKQFLIDLVNDANGSFKGAVKDQRDQLVLTFTAPNDQALIKKVCDAAIAGDERDKNSFLTQIK